MYVFWLSVVRLGLIDRLTPDLDSRVHPWRMAGAGQDSPHQYVYFLSSERGWEAELTTVDSPEVQEWLKELEGHDIPDIKPTVDGSCGGDPVAAAEAEQRAWWTCGGWTAGNDIVVCPDKNTWGVSFDDGPTPHSTCFRILRSEFRVSDWSLQRRE